MYTYPNYCFTIPYTQVDTGYAKFELNQFIRVRLLQLTNLLYPIFGLPPHIGGQKSKNPEYRHDIYNTPRLLKLIHN